MIRLVAACAGVLAVAVAALVRPEIRVLLFGWFAFLRDNLSRVTVNPTTVATSLAFVVVLLALAQYVGGWWSKSRDSQASPRRWRFRSSLAVLAVVFLMFAVGLSTVGLARHVGWLLSSADGIYIGQVE
ncbi:MAG: hypothetical protein ACYC6C_13290 [Coriobacteriia bacterium]